MTNEQNAPAHVATLRALLACCLSWEPQVCVMGNVRAGDAAAALTAALSSPPAAGDAEGDPSMEIDWLRKMADQQEVLEVGVMLRQCANVIGYLHRAAIASPAAPPPEGDWVMVPREATHEMKAAGMETSPMYQVLGTGRRVSVSDEDAGAIYAAMLAAAPKPAAPPSVTDAVRALVAKWRAGAASNDLSMEAKGIQATMHAALKHGALNLRRCADELEAALTHPGHKHAQEDPRIDRGAIAGTGQPESWDAVDEALWHWYGHKLTFTQSERRRFFDAIQAYLKHAQEDAAQEDEYARLWRGRWVAVRVEHLRDTKGYDFETATAYAEADANNLDELYAAARKRLAERLTPIDSEAK